MPFRCFSRIHSVRRKKPFPFWAMRDCRSPCTAPSTRSAKFTNDAVLGCLRTRGTMPKTISEHTVHTAVLTGWSLDRNAIFRYGAERGFALSDHADYPALLR